MAFRQLQDILARVREIHLELRERCANAAEREPDVPVRFLLDHIAEQEDGVAATLAAFESKGPERVQNSWLQVAPETDLERRLADFELPEHGSPDAIADSILRIDRALIDFLRALAGNMTTDRTREAIDSLANRIRVRDLEIARRLAELRTW